VNVTYNVNKIKNENSFLISAIHYKCHLWNKEVGNEYNQLTFNIECEVRIQFAKWILDIAFIQAWVFLSGILKIENAYLFVSFTQLVLVNKQQDAQFLCMFISILYMFRVAMCPSSGELLYRCDIWFISLCVDERLVCRLSAYQTVIYTEWHKSCVALIQ